MATTWTVVTGGSSGLGRAVVEQAVDAGEQVLEVSRSGPPEPLRSRVEHLALDLSVPAAWSTLAARVAAGLDGLSAGDRVLLLHAAGLITPIGHAGEVDPHAYAATVLVDVAAPVALGQQLLRALQRRSDLRRQLCLVSSGAATSTYVGWSAYCAGKAAVEHWVRVVGQEQAARGGTEVSAIAPGVVATGMQEAIRAVDARDMPDVQRFRDLHDDGGLTSPDDAARSLRRVLDRGTGHGAVLDLRDEDA